MGRCGAYSDGLEMSGVGGQLVRLLYKSAPLVSLQQQNLDLDFEV